MNGIRKIIYFENSGNAALTKISHGFGKHGALKIEVKDFTKKWSLKLIFLNEKNIKNFVGL